MWNRETKQLSRLHVLCIAVKVLSIDLLFVGNHGAIRQVKAGRARGKCTRQNKPYIELGWSAIVMFIGLHTAFVRSVSDVVDSGKNYEVEESGEQKGKKYITRFDVTLIHSRKSNNCNYSATCTMKIFTCIIKSTSIFYLFFLYVYLRCQGSFIGTTLQEFFWETLASFVQRSWFFADVNWCTWESTGANVYGNFYTIFFTLC